LGSGRWIDPDDLSEPARVPPTEENVTVGRNCESREAVDRLRDDGLSPGCGIHPDDGTALGTEILGRDKYVTVDLNLDSYWRRNGSTRSEYRLCSGHRIHEEDGAYATEGVGVCDKDVAGVEG
jgi:hypothetical protein